MKASKSFLPLLAAALLVGSSCSSDSSDPGDENNPRADASTEVPAADAAPNNNNSPDAMPADNGALCAEPGSLGNSEGVGLYCTTNAMCTGAASLCTVVQQADAPPFCTKVCFSDDTCGEDATCETNGGAIGGCTPTCLTQ